MRQLLLPVAAFVVLAAAPAAAQLGPPGGPSGDCEDSGDCGNPSPPQQPSLPGSGYGGEYKVYIDTNYDSVQGLVMGDQTVRINGGAYHPIGGDGTVRDGFSASNVTLRGTDPNSADGATVATTASADGGYYASESNAAQSYLVELHAKNAAAFAALTPFLGTSGAIASISGSYTLSATGQAYALAGATTGTYIPLDSSLQKSFGATCDYSGYYSSTGPNCGSAGYALDLNFVKGSTFTNGDPLSVYGVISLGTDTHAGATGLGGDAGQSSAFIDPTITLNPLFNTPLYTLNVGSQVVPVPGGGAGAVPEPAAWALLLAGFGLVGSAARRKRLTSVTA